MKRVLAIAGITMRNAVRSRVFFMLIVALIAVSILIPVSVKGDGTLAGQLQVMLRYSLGVGAFLLALATVWAGCAAVSLEIQHHRIHLVAVKPVRRSEIWFGNWVGLTILNTALLCGMGLVNYGLIRWRLTHSVGESAQNLQRVHDVLTARRLVYPPPPDVEKQVQQELEHMRSQGRVSPEIPEHQYRQAIRDRLRQRACSAGPGGSYTWRFSLTDQVPKDEAALLRFQFSPSDITLEKIRGLWRVRRERSGAVFEMEREAAPFTQQTMQVPAYVLKGTGDVIVEFVNTHERPMTVFFDPDNGVTMLLPYGSFLGNYARALLLIEFHLLCLAALGIAMGTLFSMPVASFATWCLLFVFAMLDYVQNIAESELGWAAGAETSLVQRVLKVSVTGLLYLIQKIMAPLRGPDALDLLAEGILIDPWWVLRVFTVKVLVYSGLFAAFSILIFNRRELALPST